MTNADKLNLEALVKNAREMETNAKSKNHVEEIEKIRKYCIDALEDYEDSKKKICEIINRNKDMFSKNFTGYVLGETESGTKYRLGRNNYGPKYSYLFTQATFWLNEMEILVAGVEGVLERKGYCGEFVTELTSSDNWEAADILPIKSTGYTKEPFEDDLVNRGFYSNGKHKSFTPENIPTLNFAIDVWCSIKRQADRTKLRTEDMISRFRKYFEDRLSKATNHLNSLEIYASESTYEKVNF